MESPRACLIVATYNHNKSRNLSTIQLANAEDAAEDLFPVYEESRQIEDLAQQGEFLPDALDSDLFSKVANYNPQTRELRELIVDNIYNSQPPERPVGWMVVVEEERLLAYLKRMCGNGYGRGLWPLYDVELFFLNEGWSEEDVIDTVPSLRRRHARTTEEIYNSMIPLDWGH